MILRIVLYGVLIILLGVVIILLRRKLEDWLYNHLYSLNPSSLLAHGWMSRGIFIILIGILVLVVGLFFNS